MPCFHGLLAFEQVLPHGQVKWQHLRRMLLHLAEHIAIALQNAEVYREAEQQMKFYFNSGFFVSGGLLQLCTSRPSTAAIVPRAGSTPSRACHRSHGHFEGARSPHIGAPATGSRPSVAAPDGHDARAPWWILQTRTQYGTVESVVEKSYSGAKCAVHRGG